MPQRRAPAGTRKGGQYLPTPPKPPAKIKTPPQTQIATNSKLDQTAEFDKLMDALKAAGASATQARAKNESIRPFIQVWGRAPEAPDDREGELIIHDPSQLNEYNRLAPKITITGDPESRGYQNTLHLGPSKQVLSVHKTVTEAVETGKDQLSEYVRAEDQTYSP